MSLWPRSFLKRPLASLNAPATQASRRARPTLACSSWGRCSITLRRLCSWQGWMSACAPKQSTIAPPQGLAAVDHPQPRTIGIEPTINQVAEQRTHDSGALGGTLAQSQNVLVASGVDAQGHQDDAVTEVDAIDHHRQLQLLDRAGQPLMQPRGCAPLAC